VCVCVCVCGEGGVPDDYKGLGLVDHMSSGDRGVCMCVSVFTGMRVLACRYMLICQKCQRGWYVPGCLCCSEENRKTEGSD